MIYALHKLWRVIEMNREEQDNRENNNPAEEIRRIRESTGMNRM